MRIRTLGKTGIQVGEVGFGCWAIGGISSLGSFNIGWGATDDRESIRALEAAFEQGINFFDTADVYGAGHSEDLLGRVFSGKRDKVIIASKGGNYTDKEGRWQKDFSGAYLARAVERSLGRLKTDYLDLYQLHTPREDSQYRQAISSAETLDRLVQQGKIRHYGISVGPVEHGIRQIDDNFGCTIQVVYNILEREPEKELLDKAHGSGWGIIPRVPLAYGFLTGKFTRETRFAGDDHRSHSVPPEKLVQWVDKVDRLKPIAAELGMPMAQLAIQYILAHPGVSVVIPGGKTEQQISQNAAAGTSSPLPQEILERIRQAVG